jgi:triose/dihydroxyacetone kinase / FAD-AMP lyase (cyclizing)
MHATFRRKLQRTLTDLRYTAIFLSGHDPSSTVALISGGGAGHEPAHAGYVGEGLLTAAVSGSIFASPNVSQIVNTIARVGGKAGTILIIKNYTGDIFHFHLAAEKTRAKYGLKVEIIVVGDDVSVGRERSGKVGRRGLAGTVFVHKILGAMSRKPGVSFEELVKTGKLVASNLVTVGASLGHVHIPGRAISNGHGHPKVEQIELGMGIHNETGCRVLSPQPDLPYLVDVMLDQLLNMNDSDRAYANLQDAENIVLLVNNLGSVSALELGGITKHVAAALSAYTCSRIPVVLTSE